MSNNNIKRIDIKEFRKLGFLQEANRLFFHPLGLALAVEVNEETGEEKLAYIWDYRDDIEGIFFGNDEINPDKARYVDDLKQSKLDVRKKCGANEDGIQPVDHRF